jgi:hypothetical protein
MPAREGSEANWVFMIRVSALPNISSRILEATISRWKTTKIKKPRKKFRLLHSSTPIDPSTVMASTISRRVI